MPKGLKKALKVAQAQEGADLGEDDELEFQKELEAARAAAAEQHAESEVAIGGAPASAKQYAYNKAGLLQKAKEAATPNLPWPETMAVCKFPLELEDVHDDLQREVSFYENALQAVRKGFALLREAGVPYKRPEDFLCEMAKSDHHMDKIKDKLIFEQQKMDAFEKRKNRQEQKRYNKEVQANRQAEKDKGKREALKQIDDWKKGKRQRGGPLPDDDGLEGVLSGGGGAGGKGGKRKRELKDQKYGFGGKKRKKGVHDPRHLNDLSDFNPKAGKATRRPSKGKGGKGANRPGKSVRYQNRQRRNK